MAKAKNNTSAKPTKSKRPSAADQAVEKLLNDKRLVEAVQAGVRNEAAAISKEVAKQTEAVRGLGQIPDQIRDKLEPLVKEMRGGNQEAQAFLTEHLEQTKAVKNAMVDMNDRSKTGKALVALVAALVLILLALIAYGVYRSAPELVEQIRSSPGEPETVDVPGTQAADETTGKNKVVSDSDQDKEKKAVRSQLAPRGAVVADHERWPSGTLKEGVWLEMIDEDNLGWCPAGSLLQVLDQNSRGDRYEVICRREPGSKPKDGELNEKKRCWVTVEIFRDKTRSNTVATRSTSGPARDQGAGAAGFTGSRYRVDVHNYHHYDNGGPTVTVRAEGGSCHKLQLEGGAILNMVPGVGGVQFSVTDKTTTTTDSR